MSNKRKRVLTTEDLQEACQVAEYQNLEKEEQKMISAKEKAEQDAGAEREYIWQSGKAEGKALGLAEGKAELVQMLFLKGKSAKEIAELFEMDEDKVRAIVK
jgi:hypothetical protein